VVSPQNDRRARRAVLGATGNDFFGKPRCFVTARRSSSPNHLLRFTVQRAIEGQPEDNLKGAKRSESDVFGRPARDYDNEPRSRGPHHGLSRYGKRNCCSIIAKPGRESELRIDFSRQVPITPEFRPSGGLRGKFPEVCRAGTRPVLNGAAHFSVKRPSRHELIALWPRS